MNQKKLNQYRLVKPYPTVLDDTLEEDNKQNDQMVYYQK